MASVETSSTQIDHEQRILEQLKLVEGSNLWAITFNRMKKDQLGMLGFYIVVFLGIVGVVAFILLQYDNLFGLTNPTGDPWDSHNYYIEIWIPIF